MKIDGLGNVNNFKKPEGVNSYGKPRRKSERAGGADGVELSSKAKALSALGKLPDVRIERVNAIRDQITKGTYLTQDKLDRAVENAIDEMA